MLLSAKAAARSPWSYVLIVCLMAVSGCFTGLLGQGTPNPLPLINQPLVPTATAPGGPGFTLTVRGTGFVSGATVNWKGSARPTSFFSGSELTATIFASDVAAAGTASITVQNPGSGGSSNVEFFSITESQPASPAPTFANVRQSLSFANYANAVAGDFNGDGKLDLAGLVPLATSNPVFVLLGNGNGTFQPPIIIDTGQDASVIAVGDFNSDGRLDLAIFGNTAASILLGNGDGTFQNPKPFAPGFNPGAPANVAIADFNGDGKLDLALTEPAASVSIFLGNGDGTFQNPVSYPDSPQRPPPATCCGTVGDFNGDGKLDLAFIDSAGLGIDVLLGNGDGTFQQPSFQNIALTPIGCTNGTPLSAMIAADFNGDSKLDLVPSCLTGRFQWGDLLLGNGDGTFQKDPGYDGGPGFAIGDFNADGKLDLLTEFCGSGSTQVCNPPEIFFGNGDGTFASATVGSLPDFAAGANPSMPIAGDFNGDGKLDLVFLSK